MAYLDKAALKVVGTRPIRPDGVDKVTGRAAFGADYVMPGMLWGKVKRSPHAHARIVKIDASKALIGHTLDAATLEMIDAAAQRACKPITDKRGTIAYRIKVAGVLTRRAATIAFARARGETPATMH